MIEQALTNGGIRSICERSLFFSPGGYALEMHQIRYFLAVAETLNFTRAAEQCHVAQPSLTRAIQKLEEELGGLLLHRERSHTHLTELGRLMLPYLERTYLAAQSARELARQVNEGDRAPLRIGIANTIAAGTFGKLFDRVRAQLNGFELTLRKGNGRAIVEMAVAGSLDVLFLSGREKLPDRIRSWTLFREPYHIIVAEGHPIACKSSFDISDIDGLDLIEFLDCPDREAFLDFCAEFGAFPRIRHSVDSIDHLQEAVRLHLGIGIVSRQHCSSSGITARTLEKVAFEREVAVAVVAGRPFNRATELCLRLARSRAYEG